MWITANVFTVCMSMLHSRLSLLHHCGRLTWAQCSTELASAVTLAIVAWLGSACLDAIFLPRLLKVAVLLGASFVASMRWSWEASSHYEAWSGHELCFWDTCLAPRKVLLSSMRITIIFIMKGAYLYATGARLATLRPFYCRSGDIVGLRAHVIPQLVALKVWLCSRFSERRVSRDSTGNSGPTAIGQLGMDACSADRLPQQISEATDEHMSRSSELAQQIYCVSSQYKAWSGHTRPLTGPLYPHIGLRANAA